MIGKKIAEAKPNAEEKLEQALKAVWRQGLVERARTVELEGKSYSVRRTPRRGLAQVDFSFEGREIRALEQNPETKSRWAQLARSGKKVMQFLEGGRYIANVADGDVTVYGRSKPRARASRQSS
jgi:hypothetical protein